MFWYKKKNSRFTSKDTIVNQLSERRPLPMGRQEFEEWSERIIAGTLLTADKESQKFALANLLLHLGPTESHKEDAFFIHSLRKFAVNQVADSIRIEIRDTAKARLAKEEEEKKLRLVDAVPHTPLPNPDAVLSQPSVINEPKILADKSV